MSGCYSLWGKGNTLSCRSGYFYWRGGKYSHNMNWVSETASPREVGHRSMALLGASPFSERLDTTLAHASTCGRDGFVQWEVGQVTSWLLQICHTETHTAVFWSSRNMPPCCAPNQTQLRQPLLYQWDTFFDYSNTSLTATGLSNLFFLLLGIECNIFDVLSQLLKSSMEDDSQHLLWIRGT